MELDKTVLNWAGDDVGTVDSFNIQSLTQCGRPILSPPGTASVPTDVPTVELSDPARRITRRFTRWITMRQDISLANSASIFFVLPPELRHHIYTLVCKTKKISPHVDSYEVLVQYQKSKSWRLFCNYRAHVDLRFLRTCRAIFLDARQIPLATNRCYFDGCMARADLQMFTFPTYNRHISDLTVRIYIGGADDERHWPPLLHQVLTRLTCLVRLSIDLSLHYDHMDSKRRYPDLRHSSGIKVYRESTDLLAGVAAHHSSLQRDNIFVKSHWYDWLRYAKKRADDHSENWEVMYSRYVDRLRFNGDEKDYDQWCKDHKIREKGWERPKPETLVEHQQWLSAVKERMIEAF